MPTLEDMHQQAAKYYEEILGKTAKKDYAFATPLKLEDIK